jgi:hypothetical protein
VSVTHLLFDGLFAAICGPIVAAAFLILWHLWSLASKRTERTGLSSGAIRVLIFVAYLTVIAAMFILIPAKPGMCRFDP